MDFKSLECNILIIDNNSPFVLPLLRSFSGINGIKLDVLLSSKERPHYFKYSRFLRRLYRVDELNEDNFVSVVKETTGKSKADLLIPTREWISDLLYQNKTELELLVKIHPVPDSATLDVTGNKWNLNKWLEKNDFPASKTVRAGSEWPGRYPCLLKPVRGIGGQGIRMIQDQEKLRSLDDSGRLQYEDFFIQEYIEGYDIDVSLFAINGEILFHTIQRGVISGPLIYSKGIEFVKNEEFFVLVETIIRKLNYNGIAHLDFRYNTEKKEYVLIDFNARYWSSVQGSRAMGVNFPLLATAFCLGKLTQYPDFRTGYYYFTSAALKAVLRNLFSKRKLPLRIKSTQLKYIYLDPLPEFIFLIQKLTKNIRKLTSHA